MFDFDFFRKRDYSNVVKFPESKETPKMPYIEPPEQPAKVFYRIGVTDDNTVSLQVGYSELTMTKTGVQNLIEQLQVFRDQLTSEQNKE